MTETVKVHIILNIGQGDSLRKSYLLFLKFREKNTQTEVPVRQLGENNEDVQDKNDGGEDKPTADP